MCVLKTTQKQQKSYSKVVIPIVEITVLKELSNQKAIN